MNPTTKGFSLPSGLGELFSEENYRFKEIKRRLCAFASLREPLKTKKNPALFLFQKQVKPNKKEKSKLRVLVPLWQKSPKTIQTIQKRENPEEKRRLCAFASLREPLKTKKNPALCLFQKQVKPNKKEKIKTSCPGAFVAKPTQNRQIQSKPRKC
ncbi:hypothetical protein [Flavobacterium saccharophilum]|uniref:hypothetical protein n=1 Tax=Flavobacterium saccharophilum TaxID=29534 RepID=UPI001114CEDA|nr:hypothetical protein [Flavobacterium saccharophilum]